MVKRVWNFELGGKKHTVELEYSGTWGKIETLLVDGKSVKQIKRKLTFRKSEHPFKIANHDCAIMLKSALRGYKSDLLVDGRSVEIEQGAKPAQMPKWAWAFIAACVAIPVVSLGGAIPAGIGAGGAVACAAIAKDSSKTKKKRIVMCLGVTAICWVLFVLMIFGIAFLARGG